MAMAGATTNFWMSGSIHFSPISIFSFPNKLRFVALICDRLTNSFQIQFMKTGNPRMNLSEVRTHVEPATQHS